MRQIVLDTETTGLDPKKGHRIIEIGAVEVINRRLSGNHYHQYINPEREVEQGALAVHGISNEFLQDKPLFAEIVEEFCQFVEGAELVIHNAPFDVGFINHEFKRLKHPWQKIESVCKIFDTLTLARDTFPGQRNSLDALCKRFDVDNSSRDLHGALLDSEILADVYLKMTGGQVSLGFADSQQTSQQQTETTNVSRVSSKERKLRVIQATEAELLEHKNQLKILGVEQAW